MVGGSTTECFYLDDRETPTSVLQDELNRRGQEGLRFKVYNAGKAGDASSDHISMIVHRIVHLEPDMIIVLSGVNDLILSMSGKDCLHFLPPSPDRSELGLLCKLMLTEFQIPRRLYYLTPRSREQIQRDIPVRSNIREKVSFREHAPRSDSPPRIDPTEYRVNLMTIAGVAKAQGIQLVLVTQPSTWNSKVDADASGWQWMLNVDGTTYRPDFMDAALESMNDELRHVADEQKVPVCDLARLIPKSRQFMCDDCHFNVRGAERVGTLLADTLLTKELVVLRRR
jgi:lysophospholipase L1-like esterase